ncbi:hypothetical protein [Nitrincola sp. A-D6]|uniref:hypothetical protein n=1 Tax=Nitrincola sp. A-D6 TaxID=1545442 RepID=UPI00068B5348|nr:hypothetical protein [Nitrincola sp. A-D6]
MIQTIPSPRPVFSLLVAGHRQQRLERNWLKSESVALDTELLQSCLRHTLFSIRSAAAQAFHEAADVYAQEPFSYRMLTGEASGIDQMAAQQAHPCGYSLQRITPTDTPNTETLPTEPTVVLEMHSPIPDQPLSQEDYSLRDNLALSFADLLVAVWDKQEPMLITSGTARVIRSALLRRKPVVLICPDRHQGCPVLMLSRQASLTEAHLLELETLSCDSELLLNFFAPVENEALLSSALQAWMQVLLAPFIPAKNSQSVENKQLQQIKQQQPVLIYIYHWLACLFTIGRHPRPVSLCSWLAGAYVWLQVMLNPPERTQESRLLELLTQEPHGISLRERLISRLHLFCSAIARLNLTDLKASLRPSETIAGYHKVIPQVAINNPIKEPDLAVIFNWADQQAGVFGRRYRDSIWMTYYAAAFAVFCAVAGALGIWPATLPGLLMVWAVFEFVLLRFIIGHVLQARFRDWHGHWMSYRYLAEQLRYLRIGYPLLVMPQAFLQPTWSPSGKHREAQLTSAENWLLQRTLVAEGLPRNREGAPRYRLTEHNPAMVDYLRQVLNEHRHYFAQSHDNLHRDHIYLHRLAFALFFITFLAVTLHFFVKISWILIFTAFFPAWGAAIHGILSHNEVVRMSSLAGQVWGKLSVLSEACDDFYQRNAGHLPASAQQQWRQTQELRELLGTLTHILSDENQHWRSLNRHNQADLPA